MEDFKERMTQLLTIQSSEGIQPDYLFGQHCGHGRQLYFTSYGKEFVNSTLAYLELCKDTRFQSPGLELLRRRTMDILQQTARPQQCRAVHQQQPILFCHKNIG